MSSKKTRFQLPFENCKLWTVGLLLDIDEALALERHIVSIGFATAESNVPEAGPVSSPSLSCESTRRRLQLK